MNLEPRDRRRLAAMLAKRAQQMGKDAEDAERKSRHPELVKHLRSEETWARAMAYQFLEDDFDEQEGDRIADEERAEEARRLEYQRNHPERPR